MSEKLQSKIGFRDPHPDDLQILRQLRNDANLQHLILAYPGNESADDTVEWLRRRSNEKNGTFKIIVDEENRAVGFVQIADVHRRGKFGYAGVCIRSGARNQGIGTAALKWLSSFAASTLGLRKLLLQVRADNLQALSLYGKLGFKTVGSLREHYYDGTRWHDVILMELLLGAKQ